jgi:hypothetical protein
MKSAVDFTFGFNCSIVATGIPVFLEMTAKVSPACTVLNRGPDRVVVVVRVVVGADTVFRAVVGTTTVVVGVDVPERRPERISRMAIVAASRNAAGAT